MKAIAAIILILALPIGYLAALAARSTPTELKLQDHIKVIGTNTPIRIVAVNPHGIRRFTAVLEQDGKSYPVFERQEPARRWAVIRKVEDRRTYTFEAGSKAAPGLRDGKVMLRMEAVSNDLLARREPLQMELEVNTKPPAVSVDEGQHYITLGGSEVVAFTVAGYWTEAGVRVGKYTFRSFPMPGANSPNRRICFFAYPYDAPEGTVPIVYTRNPTGAEATARFWNKVTRKKFRTREIVVGDAFLNKIFADLDPGGSGNPVARFMKINNEMRQANAQTLASFRDVTAGKILWNGPFIQLANSSVEAQFCDFRKYFYHGQSVDQQVHLGFDLAVTARTPVVAANDGKVIHAGPLGIYGNTIVIDHGLGLQSLYAHLSEIQAKAGSDAKKGQVIGKSGATGLAGGDHLHYGMQVDGVPVNPVEWWDAHWIKDRVLSVLAR